MPTETLIPGTPRLLDRPHGRLAYEDHGGRGPLVIAVPSLGDLRAEYRFLAPSLVAAGYHVVALDVRDHGESSAGWPDHSVAAIGGDLLALIDRLDAGPAILIGTSMAGGASVWAAAEAPSQVAGLVLIGPFVRNVPVGALQRLALKAMLRRPWGPSAWGRYYRSLYPVRQPADLAPYSSALVRNLREPGRFEAAAAMVWTPKTASEERLAAVHAPALVIMGDRDPDFKDPAAEARLVAERVRGELALIPGGGHYPHVDTPDETGARIRAFLDRASGRAGADGR